MDIFDKISNAASKTYEITSNKTCKIAKETKIRFAINEAKCKIYDLYEEIGKDVYEKYILENRNKEETIDEIKMIKNEINEYCNQIDILGDKVEKYRMDILKINEKKKCENCLKKISIEMKYCPYCGTKQKDIEDINDIKDKSKNIGKDDNKKNMEVIVTTKDNKDCKKDEKEDSKESENNNEDKSNLNSNDNNSNESKSKNVINKEEKIKKEIDGENYKYDNDLNKK